MTIQEQPLDRLYDVVGDDPWDTCKLILALLRLIHQGHSTQDPFVCMEPCCEEARELVGLC